MPFVMCVMSLQIHISIWLKSPILLEIRHRLSRLKAMLRDAVGRTREDFSTFVIEGKVTKDVDKYGKGSSDDPTKKRMRCTSEKRKKVSRRSYDSRSWECQQYSVHVSSAISGKTLLELESVNDIARTGTIIEHLAIKLQVLHRRIGLIFRGRHIRGQHARSTPLHRLGRFDRHLEFQVVILPPKRCSICKYDFRNTGRIPPGRFVMGGVPLNYSFVSTDTEGGPDDRTASDRQTDFSQYEFEEDSDSDEHVPYRNRAWRANQICYCRSIANEYGRKQTRTWIRWVRLLRSNRMRHVKDSNWAHNRNIGNQYSKRTAHNPLRILDVNIRNSPYHDISIEENQIDDIARVLWDMGLVNLSHSMRERRKQLATEGMPRDVAIEVLRATGFHAAERKALITRFQRSTARSGIAVTGRDCQDQMTGTAYTRDRAGEAGMDHRMVGSIVVALTEATIGDKIGPNDRAQGQIGQLSMVNEDGCEITWHSTGVVTPVPREMETEIFRVSKRALGLNLGTIVVAIPNDHHTSRKGQIAQIVEESYTILWHDSGGETTIKANQIHELLQVVEEPAPLEIGTILELVAQDEWLDPEDEHMKAQILGMNDEYIIIMWQVNGGVEMVRKSLWRRKFRICTHLNKVALPWGQGAHLHTWEPREVTKAGAKYLGVYMPGGMYQRSAYYRVGLPPPYVHILREDGRPIQAPNGACLTGKGLKNEARISGYSEIDEWNARPYRPAVAERGDNQTAAAEMGMLAKELWVEDVFRGWKILTKTRRSRPLISCSECGQHLIGKQWWKCTHCNVFICGAEVSRFRGTCSRPQRDQCCPRCIPKKQGISTDHRICEATPSIIVETLNREHTLHPKIQWIEETARIDVGQTCMQSWKLTHEFGNKIQFVPSIDKRNFTYGRMVYNKYVDWHYIIINLETRAGQTYHQWTSAWRKAPELYILAEGDKAEWEFANKLASNQWKPTRTEIHGRSALLVRDQVELCQNRGSLVWETLIAPGMSPSQFAEALRNLRYVVVIRTAPLTDTDADGQRALADRTPLMKFMHMVSGNEWQKHKTQAVVSTLGGMLPHINVLEYHAQLVGFEWKYTLQGMSQPHLI